MNKLLTLILLIIVLAACLSPHTWRLKQLGETPCPDCDCNDPWVIEDVE